MPAGMKKHQAFAECRQFNDCMSCFQDLRVSGLADCFNDADLLCRARVQLGIGL